MAITTPQEARAHSAGFAKGMHKRADEVEELRAALAELVEAHDYSHLDRGIGTALPEGKMWLRARELAGAR